MRKVTYIPFAFLITVSVMSLQSSLPSDACFRSVLSISIRPRTNLSMSLSWARTSNVSYPSKTDISVMAKGRPVTIKWSLGCSFCSWARSLAVAFSLFEHSSRASRTMNIFETSQISSCKTSDSSLSVGWVSLLACFRKSSQTSRDSPFS